MPYFSHMLNNVKVIYFNDQTFEMFKFTYINFKILTTLNLADTLRIEVFCISFSNLQRYIRFPTCQEKTQFYALCLKK